jgi:hypothetical protein
VVETFSNPAAYFGGSKLKSWSESRLSLQSCSGLCGKMSEQCLILVTAAHFCIIFNSLFSNHAFIWWYIQWAVHCSKGIYSYQFPIVYQSYFLPFSGAISTFVQVKGMILEGTDPTAYYSLNSLWNKFWQELMSTSHQKSVLWSLITHAYRFNLFHQQLCGKQDMQHAGCIWYI